MVFLKLENLKGEQASPESYRTHLEPCLISRVSPEVLLKANGLLVFIHQLTFI